MRLQNAVVSGTLAELLPTGNLRVAGEMVLDGLVGAVARIGNIDRAAALALVAGILQFDPLDSPAIIPTKLEFLLD